MKTSTKYVKEHQQRRRDAGEDLVSTWVPLEVKRRLQRAAKEENSPLGAYLAKRLIDFTATDAGDHCHTFDGLGEGRQASNEGRPA